MRLLFIPLILFLFFHLYSKFNRVDLPEDVDYPPIPYRSGPGRTFCDFYDYEEDERLRLNYDKQCGFRFLFSELEMRYIEGDYLFFPDDADGEKMIKLFESDQRPFEGCRVLFEEWIASGAIRPIDQSVSTGTTDENPVKEGLDICPRREIEDFYLVESKTDGFSWFRACQSVSAPQRCNWNMTISNVAIARDLLGRLRLLPSLRFTPYSGDILPRGY